MEEKKELDSDVTQAIEEAIDSIPQIKANEITHVDLGKSNYSVRDIIVKDTKYAILRVGANRATRRKMVATGETIKIGGQPVTLGGGKSEKRKHKKIKRLKRRRGLQ